MSEIVDLQEVGRVLRRRRALIVGAPLGVLALTLAVLAIMPARYTAVAQVIVDPRQQNVVDLEQVLTGLPANAETIASEIEVLTSRPLASRAVQTLHPSQPLVPEAIDDFQRHLKVAAVGRSRVINIAYTSPNAAEAASAANRLADLYLAAQSEAKNEATRRASLWLEERLGQLRTDAEAAEVAAARFRSDEAFHREKPEEAAARQRSLEREAMASRTLYETFLSRYKETTEQEGLALPDARLLTRADVPRTASFPDYPLAALLALIGGLALGLGAAFVRERLDAGFSTAEQVEEQLGLPVLALLPALTTLGVKGRAPEAYLLEKPTSTLAEAVRMLRTSLHLTQGQTPPRVLLVTSALPGEGKTSAVLMLARLAALSGDRVLVIDADLRCPRVHKALGLANGPGLMDLLAGRATAEHVLHTSAGPAATPGVVHYITAGAGDLQESAMLRSAQMQQLLQVLSQNYTLIIIDSPPVLAVADTRLLATLADKVLYVVHWQATRREAALQAVKQMRDVGAVFAGAVLNCVDARRQADYSYGDGSAYDARTRRYYHD